MQPNMFLKPDLIARAPDAPKLTLEGLKFIDLFAGIGGIRIGFDKLGAECVFTSEKDKFAQQTYLANFKDPDAAKKLIGGNFKVSEFHHVAGDITEVHEDDVPDHDILLAGFPCQAFSQAGLKKGLSDTRGTMFYHIARILEAKRPDVFVLENVKHLERHDKGNTFSIIYEKLTGLDYQISYKVIDALHFVPQHRERIIIIGTRGKDPISPNLLDQLTLPGISPADNPMQRLRHILHDENSPSTEEPEGHYTLRRIHDDNSSIRVNEKYTISDKLWNYLQERKKIQTAKGNGFGYNLVDPDRQPGYTLSARYYKDGSENLVPTPSGNPRKLTPRECARLMGFPDSFRIPVSDTQAYKQFGNSVAVPLFEAIAQLIAVHVEKKRSEA